MQDVNKARDRWGQGWGHKVEGEAKAILWTNHHEADASYHNAKAKAMVSYGGITHIHKILKRVDIYNYTGRDSGSRNPDRMWNSDRK